MAHYRLKLRCRNPECMHVYTRVVDRLDLPDPPCPKCRKKAKKKPTTDYSDGRAPAIGGTNMRNKAIDATAEVVMRDYSGMGVHDLRDSGGVREGDVIAPKLPPAQQSAADNFFSRKARKSMPFDPGALGRAAIAGAYAPQRSHAPDPVMAVHGPKIKPATKIIYSDDGNKT